MNKLIEYYVTDDSINIFVIGPNLPKNLVSLSQPYSYSLLDRRVKAFRETLIKGADYQEIAAELYSLLIQPLMVRSLISNGESLYIAPHRCLHYIPFQALGVDQELLLITNPVAYLPVGSSMKSFVGIKKDGTGCLVVKRSGEADGVILRESFEREAKRVAAIAHGDVIRDRDATPSRIHRSIPGRMIVHFTCHGVFDESKPKQSGLLLSNEEGKELLWTVSDISALPLKVDLVTLAACETGISERHPGNELIGLVRAVTLAGARSVIATLWPVHSLSTELLITRFYESYLSGKTKVESLRLAQISLLTHSRGKLIQELEAEESTSDPISESEMDLIKARLKELRRDATRSSLDDAIKQLSDVDYPYCHPYFWSPFILVGGWQ